MLTTPSGIIISVAEQHELNASSPIFVTPFGITIDSSCVFPANAFEQIDLIPSFNFIDVKLLFKNAPTPISSTLLGTSICFKPVCLKQ